MGMLALMLTWETLSPRRPRQQSRLSRWSTNFGLALLNIWVVRLTLGTLAYDTAVYAQSMGWGLCHYLSLPAAAAITITLLGLDCAIYLQHILAHQWSWLWRLHQVHHSDLEFDATTAVRFHPLEILLSLLYKVFWIIVLGANPLGVIAFEVLLNASATFNHSNINLPTKLERCLRWIIVTPDMHRIHHSVEAAEMNSNYGFALSGWDRLFKTYRGNADKSQLELIIGLKHLRVAREIGLLQLLWLPFKRLGK